MNDRPSDGESPSEAPGEALDEARSEILGMPAHAAHVSEDPLVSCLQRIIRHAARVLAVLMVLVIWWGVADVVYVLYSRASSHPYYLLEISDIFATFGAFMAVLIAIEVFVNIVSYLHDGGLQLEIVLATAYMAVLRKIIILDYKEVSSDYVYATAGLALALAVGYWLSRSRGEALAGKT